jgi:hypothetical protein
MTPAEEQQMLASLAEISASMQGLLALTRDMSSNQDKVSEKTLQHLGNIAHKR